MTINNDGRFVDSDTWRRLADKADSVDFSVLQEAAMRLTEGDLRDLSERLNPGSEKEQYAALWMLLLAVRSDNRSLGFLSSDLREKTTQLAKGWVIEEPPSPFDKKAVMRWARAMFSGNLPVDIAFRAYTLLAAIDKEAAAQFLVSHFPHETLSTHVRDQVIQQFANLCSEDKNKRSNTAMRRLIDIAEKGEPGANKAAQCLIGRRLMRRSEVEKVTERWRATPSDALCPSAVAEFIALHPRFAGREEELTKQAADWLKTKSAAALNRLYYDFICTLPEGAPIRPLLAIMGTPNWWEESDPYVYNFSSDEGPALQVHLTTDGKLGGLALK